MKKFAFALLTLSVLAVLDACAPDQLPPTPTDPAANARKEGKPMSRQEIDAFIEDAAYSVGGGMSGPFYEWGTTYASSKTIDMDYLVWSMTKHAGTVLTVGYQIPGYDFKDLTKINLKEKAWLEARQKILNLVFEEEKAFNKELTNPNDVVVYPEDVLPNFELNITQLSTLRKLRETGLIRYVYSSEYQHKGAQLPNGNVEKNGRAAANGFGCGNHEVSAPYLTPGTDYTFLAPFNSKISWNLPIHRMPTAWSRGATGHGQYIGYIDTGASDQQGRLNWDFWQGGSGSRLLERTWTLPNKRNKPAETHHDPCGHGTCSAGIGVAPQMGTSSVGVAYQASLVSVRASADVLFTSARECRGVANAFTRLANHPNVRVISMSMGTVVNFPYTINGLGTPFTMGYTHIGDAVRLAYQRGKLIFCAAGTLPGAGLNLTIFPANMDNEVQAVTGVKAHYATGNGGLLSSVSQYTNHLLEPCDECFYGNSVDFGVVMQKNNYGTATRILTLARQNYAEPVTFGGSSAATATMSAMAIAVWSKYPNETGAQILARLRRSATNFPNRHSTLGWGLVNMDLATQ